MKYKTAKQELLKQGYKQCNRCYKTLPKELFYKRDKTKRLYSKCFDCRKIEYQAIGREKAKKAGRLFYPDIKEGVCVVCGSSSNKFSLRSETKRPNRMCNPCRWKRQNKETHYERKLEKERTDQKTRINKLMRHGIRKNLQAQSINKNGRKWETMVDYTTEELIKHLKKSLAKLNNEKESTYSWKDFMNGGLHIDHIIPISFFDFESPDDPQFKKCWSLDNLQLLSAFDNISKGNRI